MDEMLGDYYPTEPDEPLYADTPDPEADAPRDELEAWYELYKRERDTEET